MALAALALDAGLSSAAQALPISEGAAVRSDGQEARYPVPSGDGAVIDRKEGVIIARVAGRIYALSLTCPHQNTALRWNDGSRTFFCTRHKSKYRPDGAFISGRATRAMDRFALRREGEALVVTLTNVLQQDTDQGAWEAAYVPV